MGVLSMWQKSSLQDRESLPPPLSHYRLCWMSPGHLSVQGGHVAMNTVTCCEMLQVLQGWLGHKPAVWPWEGPFTSLGLVSLLWSGRFGLDGLLESYQPEVGVYKNCIFILQQTILFSHLLKGTQQSLKRYQISAGAWPWFSAGKENSAWWWAVWHTAFRWTRFPLHGICGVFILFFLIYCIPSSSVS